MEGSFLQKAEGRRQRAYLMQTSEYAFRCKVDAERGYGFSFVDHSKEGTHHAEDIARR
jgi:hypothetical protein